VNRPLMRTGVTACRGTDTRRYAHLTWTAGLPAHQVVVRRFL